MNHIAAEEYLCAAACNNYAQAQFDLAGMLYDKDDDGFQEAMHWLCCAHLNGVEKATELLNVAIQNGNESAVRANIAYIQAHGVIPRKLAPAPQPDGGGCYIATAVYGSYDAPEVLTLRSFRDQVLQKHWLGRCFIKVYYFLSPPIANRLKNAKRINNLVRAMLDRLVAQLAKD